MELRAALSPPGVNEPLTLTRDRLFELITTYDRPGPRYTSYPTAVEFHEGFRDAECRPLRHAEAPGLQPAVARPAGLHAGGPSRGQQVAGRAPAVRGLIRVMLGGAHDPSAIRLDDDAAIGLAAAPDFVRVFRHPVGIPQYTVRHLDRLARIERGLTRSPGLAIAGNAYRGVSINNCMAEAGPLASAQLAGPPA